MSDPKWLIELHRIGALRGFLSRARELCKATFLLGVLYSFDKSLGWIGPVLFVLGYALALYRAITLLSEIDALSNHLDRDWREGK